MDRISKMGLTKEQQLRKAFKIILRSYLDINDNYKITPLTNDLLREVRLRTNLVRTIKEKANVKILIEASGDLKKIEEYTKKLNKK